MGRSLHYTRSTSVGAPGLEIKTYTYFLHMDFKKYYRRLYAIVADYGKEYMVRQAQTLGADSQASP